jgi:hypothetical protein
VAEDQHAPRPVRPLSDRRLNPDVLGRRPDDELVADLTAIPGIGPWTVQGALIIALKREDVVLPGDLALRKAIQAALSAGSPPQPAGRPRRRREMAALPQPGDQLPTRSVKRVRDLIVAEARGNPLALLELP